ncbi:MAG: hypothetical protein JKY56_21265 [Kofleriaceae bacterium]|nr:hypothetical protein [Kofleriaceae bacterium]
MRRFSLLAFGLSIGLCYPSTASAQEAAPELPAAPETEPTAPVEGSAPVAAPESSEPIAVPADAPAEEPPTVPTVSADTAPVDVAETVPEESATAAVVSASDTGVSAALDDAEAPSAPASYKPLASTIWNGMYFAAPLQLGGVVESTSSFGLDRYGTVSSSDASTQPLVRIGATFSSLKKFSSITFQAEYEHDVFTGRANQGLAMDDAGLVEDGSRTSELRKAYGVIGIKDRFWLGGGAMTSSWGLGLLANAGDQVWEPGTARFTSPRGGDRVLRAFAVVGVSKSLGMAFRIGADSVLGDDVLLSESDRLRGDVDPLVEDDEAHQFVAALTFGEGKNTSGGAYVAYRNQSAVTGETTEVIAIDFHGKTQQMLGESRLELEAEAALILGDTEWAPTMDFATHDVRQLGIAARASYHHPKNVGAVADFLYASGDSNFDDETQTAFKADRNYDMGMLLFRQVVTGQTARAVATASDLDLVGEPSEDIERFATRGSVSNTISFFPRAYYRPWKGLEVYGGPLFAITVSDYADPLNSRLAGGTARNALDAKPGRYLGTELDLGLRYRQIVSGSELTIGVEGGFLMPGSVFDDSEGNGLDNVYGVRTVLNYRL